MYWAWMNLFTLATVNRLRDTTPPCQWSQNGISSFILVVSFNHSNKDYFKGNQESFCVIHTLYYVLCSYCNNQDTEGKKYFTSLTDWTKLYTELSSHKTTDATEVEY